MNEAVTRYTKTWFPDIDSVPDPCLEELFSTHEEDVGIAGDENVPIADAPVLVTAQDYGQSLVLPHFKKERPNVDYFQSDLNIHMFNVCNIITQKNKVYLYDERSSGKDGNTVSSMRWHYYQEVIRNAGDRVPKLVIKVMDNCVGQNKSQLTMLFDAFCSLVLFERVADFYLIPGHSHMRPDNVTGLCKIALKKKNLFLPEHLQQEMDQVKNVESVLLTEGQFFDWSILNKYMKVLPGGFTSSYMFEFYNGTCVYKRLYTDADEAGSEHCFANDPKSVRRLLLADIFGLPEDATPSDVVRAQLLLPVLPAKKIQPSREKSIAMKLNCVPTQYRAYYPGYSGEANLEDQENTPTSRTQVAPAKEPKKKKLGRPKKISASTHGTQSIIKFTLGKRPAEAASAPEATDPVEQTQSSNNLVLKTANRTVIHVDETGSPHVHQPPKAARATVITVDQDKAADITTLQLSADSQEMEVVQQTTGRPQRNIFELMAQPTYLVPASAISSARSVNATQCPWVREDPGVEPDPMQCPWARDDPGVDDSVQ